MQPLWPIGLELNVKIAHVINPRGRFQVQCLWAQRTPARETSATYKQSSLGVIWVCYREVRAPQRQINLHSTIWLFKRVMDLSLYLPARGQMSSTHGHSKPTVSWTCKWVGGGGESNLKPMTSLTEEEEPTGGQSWIPLILSCFPAVQQKAYRRQREPELTYRD